MNNILGIQVKHPTTRDLVLVAAYIVGIAVIGAAGNRFGFIPAHVIAPATSALVAGAILSAFGISVAKHGWRALVLVVAAASLFWWGLRTLQLL